MIANFAVTYRCQSRCRNCNIWRIEDVGKEELSLEEIGDLFSSNRKFLSDIRSIQITGGEPFLRDDLPEILSTIHGTLPECAFWIPTNGLNPHLIEKGMGGILGALEGVDVGVSVSIDGIGETHDELRGINGSFEMAVDTLARLSLLRGDDTELQLSVGMTLTPINSGEMMEVYSLARSLNAEFSFRPINFSEHYYRNQDDTFNPRTSVEEILPVIQKIGHDILKRRGLRASLTTLRYMQGTLDYIRKDGVRTLPCTAGSDSFFLDTNGDVYPCIIMDRRMGNIREEKLGKLWYSETSERTRQRIAEGRCPGCWVECEVYREILNNKLSLTATALNALMHPSTAGIY